MGRWIRLLLWPLVLTSACGPISVPSSVAPDSFPRTATLATIEAAVCHDTGIRGVVHSDPDDPRVAWLVEADGREYDIVWPHGYRAEFFLLGDEVFLRTYDHKGRVFVTTTDIPRSVCATGNPGVVLLMQTSP